MIALGSAACGRRKSATLLGESLAEFRLSQKPEKSGIYFLTGSAGQKILLSRKCARQGARVGLPSPKLGSRWLPNYKKRRSVCSGAFVLFSDPYRIIFRRFWTERTLRSILTR